MALGIGSAIATSATGIAFADAAGAAPPATHSTSASDVGRHPGVHPPSRAAARSRSAASAKFGAAPTGPSSAAPEASTSAAVAAIGKVRADVSSAVSSARARAVSVGAPVAHTPAVAAQSGVSARTVQTASAQSSAPRKQLGSDIALAAQSLVSAVDVTRRPLQSSTASNVTTAAAATKASVSTPPFFPAAHWLWDPIPANPTIAANSAIWVSELSAPGTEHVADLYDYAVTLVSGSSITAFTPRYKVKLTEPWGTNPFGSTTVPIPLGTQIPPGTDGQIAVLDPVTGKVFGIWQAKYNKVTRTWTGSWGGVTAISGNGIDTSGSTTATGISRYAGVITAAEFSTAIENNTGLDHALVVSSNIAGPGFVGPAIKSDGTNIAGVATPIPEGYRIQLDPSIDVDAIPGITPAEKVIAKTLQTYGAYVVDQGGSALAFAFQLVPGATSSNPGSAWTSAGLNWDYADMPDIPWSQLRVIAA